jgi:hypothetical protein
VPILKGKETKVRDVLYTGYRDGQRAVMLDGFPVGRRKRSPQAQHHQPKKPADENMS